MKINLLLFALSMIDIVASISIFLKISFYSIYFLLFIKGVWSLITGFLTKDFLIIPLSLIDIFTSLVGIFSIYQLKIIAILCAIKGIYSLLFSF